MGGGKVHRIAKLIIVIGSLICVLAIFIAPLVDLPDTVRREHDSVRAVSMQFNPVFHGAMEVRGLVRYEENHFHDVISLNEGQVALSYETALVLRC